MTKEKQSDIVESGRYWGPSIQKLWNEMDCMFRDVFGKDWGWTTTVFEEIQPISLKTFPRVDVSETDSGYEVEIAVAGFDKNEVKLEIIDNSLIISADKEKSKDATEKKYLRREISRKSFKRVVVFPSKINEESGNASYDDGVIVVKFNKEVLPPKQDKKLIEIK